MIAIINKGGPADGVCKYHVQINEDFIAEFEHDRKDGLEVCLIKATRAVHQAEFDKWLKILEDENQNNQESD